VSDDQTEILRNIARLFLNGDRFHLDPTYSRGLFYVGCPEFDPELQSDLATGVDCRSLPYDSASIRSIVFDPPFIHAHGQESEIGKRFSSYRTQHQIRALYFAALVEFYRVLKPKGILVFKTQDIVESGRQVWNHVHVFNLAENLGFVALDLFILVAHNRLVGHNHGEQQHARKFHSYFWVFEKGTRR